MVLHFALSLDCLEFMLVFIQLCQHCLLNPVKINRHMGEPGRRWGGQKGTLVRGGLGWPRAQGAHSYTAHSLRPAVCRYCPRPWGVSGAQQPENKEK